MNVSVWESTNRRSTTRFESSSREFEKRAISRTVARQGKRRTSRRIRLCRRCRRIRPDLAGSHAEFIIHDQTGSGSVAKSLPTFPLGNSVQIVGQALYTAISRVG